MWLMLFDSRYVDRWPASPLNTFPYRQWVQYKTVLYWVSCFSLSVWSGAWIKLGNVWKVLTWAWLNITLELAWWSFWWEACLMCEDLGLDSSSSSMNKFTRGPWIEGSRSHPIGLLVQPVPQLEAWWKNAGDEHIVDFLKSEACTVSHCGISLNCCLAMMCFSRMLV